VVKSPLRVYPLSAFADSAKRKLLIAKKESLSESVASSCPLRDSAFPQTQRCSVRRPCDKKLTGVDGSLTTGAALLLNVVTYFGDREATATSLRVSSVREVRAVPHGTNSSDSSVPTQEDR
jgi:hypothetical protein